MFDDVFLHDKLVVRFLIITITRCLDWVLTKHGGTGILSRLRTGFVQNVWLVSWLSVIEHVQDAFSRYLKGLRGASEREDKNAINTVLRSIWCLSSTQFVDSLGPRIFPIPSLDP